MSYCDACGADCDNCAKIDDMDTGQAILAEINDRQKKRIAELEGFLVRALPSMNHEDTCEMNTRTHNPECTCVLAEVRTQLRHVDTGTALPGKDGD